MSLVGSVKKDSKQSSLNVQSVEDCRQIIVANSGVSENPADAVLVTDTSANSMADVPSGAGGQSKNYTITVKKTIKNPLIEYSFAFGDCRSATTQSETNHVRIGLNLLVAGSVVQAIGAIDADGGLDGYDSNTATFPFGSGSGRGTGYYPVCMRYLHNVAITTGQEIKLTIAATDVIQFRLRDVILTVRELG
jgi:hypothetical protein